MPVIRVEAKVQSIEDDLQGVWAFNNFNLIEGRYLVYEESAVREAVLLEIKDLAAYHLQRLVPCAFDLIGFLVVNGGEDISGGEYSVWNKEVRIEVLLLPKAHLLCLTHPHGKSFPFSCI